MPAQKKKPAASKKSPRIAENEGLEKDLQDLKTYIRKAEIKAIKSGSKAAKATGTMSKASRNSMQLNEEFNKGYISGKQDIAAFKRNQAKQAMKKMGKKK